MYGQKSKRLNVKQYQDNIPVGFAYRPSISIDLDDIDHINGFWPGSKVTGERINGNIAVIKSILDGMKNSCQGIVEIGVVFPSGTDSSTSTEIFLANKLETTPYLGIDINDKSHINNSSKNVYTFQGSSFEQEKVREEIKKIGMTKISLLMIDGLHSINAVINDWKYSDLLADDGAIIFHDTNFHPGPIAVVDAIDETLYEITKFFEDRNDDYGISVVRRKIS